FALLLATAGALWLFAAALFSRIIEYPGATEGGGSAITEAVRQIGLVRRERDLRQFLIVRTLLLPTALVRPIYAELAGRESGATEGGGNASAEAVRQTRLIRRARDLRQFLLVRTLLLSTALVAPFYVARASRESRGQVSELGGMLIASGAAGFVSAPVWGRLS